MTTKTMKEKAAELLQRCEVVTLASVNKEGYPRPVPMSIIRLSDSIRNQSFLVNLLR